MGRLDLADITCEDSFDFTFSVWFRVPSLGWNDAGFTQVGRLFIGGLVSCQFACTNGSSSYSWQFDAAGQYVDDPFGPSPPDSLRDHLTISKSSVSYNAWNHVVCSMNAGAGPQRMDTGGAAVGVFDAVPISGVYSIDHSSAAAAPIGSGVCLGLDGSHVAFFGKAVNIPFLQDGASGPLEMANFIMWTSTYVDVTDPDVYSKFVTISGGVGRPVNPTVAVNAFGDPDILFKGKASDLAFFTNRGTGGAAELVGTASDFTPGPSFG